MSGIPSFPAPPPPPVFAPAGPQRPPAASVAPAPPLFVAPAPSAPGQDDPFPAMSPATAERERAAEEAILQSLEHVVTEYVRQDLLERLGVSERPAHREPGAPAPGEVEFTPGPCKHNGKIAVLVAIVAFGLLPMMSTVSVSIALIGCVAVYIADYLNYKHGSLVVLAISLACFGLSLWAINLATIWTSAGGFMMLSNVALLLLACFCWAVLQYRWIQLTFPELVCFLERLVLGVFPVLSLPSLFATTLAFCGARNGTFAFALLMCGVHRVFYCRLPSSFKVIVGAHPNHDENFATGKHEARVFSLLTFLFPMVAYMLVQSNWLPETIGFHFANQFALLGISLCYLFHDVKRTLWFFFPFGETLMDQIRNDPLDIWRSIEAGHKALVGICAFVLLHWGVYRLLHSRYAYLFAGVPFPFNALLLTLACYAFVFVGYATYKLLKDDAAGKDSKASPFNTMRVVILLLSVASALLIGIVMGMPGFFLPMTALSASCFNAYLLDRRQPNNFFMFICSSAMLMLWWMYKTFSYVIVDLKVLNDSVVPVPLLAVSMLWCYIVGCIAFNLSFSPNKGVFKAVLAMWALKMAWIEHVLYSQKESGTYPAFLVFFTSAAAVYVTVRLYRQDVLDGNFYTGLVVGLWLSKVVTFLQEITQERYVGEYASDFSKGATALRAVEVLAGNIGGALAGAAFFTLETEKIEKKRRTEPTMVLTYALSCLVVVASSRRNAVRAAFEAISHYGADYTIPRQLGLIAAITGILCVPVLLRHGLRFAKMQTLVTTLLLVGTALFVADPLIEAVIDPEEDDSDIAFLRPRGWARVLSVVAALLLVCGRVIPFASKELPAAFRISYWAAFSVVASAATCGMLLPTVNVHVTVALCSFIALSVVVIDICHYTPCERYVAWILYGAAVLSMVVTYITLNSVDLSNFTKNEVYLYEAHTSARLALLSLTFCIKLGMGILLKCRLSGVSLLPRPRPLTHNIVTQVGLVCNYCVLLGVITSFIIIRFNGEGNPLLYIASSLTLLLLHDDEVLFFDLHRDLFRYFPSVAAMCVALWGTHLNDAYTLLVAKGVWDAVRLLAPALCILPSHLSVLSLLYFGKRKGGVVMGAVFVFVALDVAVLLLTSMPVVRWIAMVGVCSQVTRLFAAEFWRRSHSTLL